MTQLQKFIEALRVLEELGGEEARIYRGTVYVDGPRVVPGVNRMFVEAAGFEWNHGAQMWTVSL